MPSNDPSPLYKDWSSEFQYWRKNEWFNPVKIVAQADTSESYKMDRTTLFQNKNRSYVLAYESGCSCYSPENAKLELFPNMKTVKAHLKTVPKNTYSNDSRIALLGKLSHA